MTDEDVKFKQYGAVLKVKEALRDCLYLKYGDQWMEHDRMLGKFWHTGGEMTKLMAFLMAFADGNETAVKAVKEFDE